MFKKKEYHVEVTETLSRIVKIEATSAQKAMEMVRDMPCVWRLPAIARWEKSQGKHPTQKPLALLARIILASTKPGAWILDPFSGSSTTGIAANLLGRRYLGIEREEEFLRLSRARREELESLAVVADYRHRIKDIALMEKEQEGNLSFVEENVASTDLPF